MSYPPPDPDDPTQFEPGQASVTPPHPPRDQPHEPYPGQPAWPTQNDYPPPAQHAGKSRRPVWIILGVLGGLVGLCCIGGTVAAVVSAGTKKTPTAATSTGPPALPASAVAPPPSPAPATTKPAPSPTTAVAAAPSAAPSAAQAPPPGPKTLLTVKGSGIKKSQIFTTDDEWSLAYTYDCASFGSVGNFQVYEYDAQGNMQDVLVNELDKKGSDTLPVHADPGQHYLDVNSECRWTVTVTG